MMLSLMKFSLSMMTRPRQNINFISCLHDYFHRFGLEDIFLNSGQWCVQIVFFHKKAIAFWFCLGKFFCFCFHPSFLGACIYSMNYVAIEFQDRDTQKYISAPTKKLASQCGKSCQTLQPAGSKYLDFANSEDCLFFKKFRPYCTKNCHNVKVHFRVNPNKFRLTDIAKIV